jgi:hypothetical protein
MSIENLINDNKLFLSNENQNIEECMCILNASQLMEYSEQWEYNRILNIEKVEDIMKNIKNKIILNTVIHCYYFNNKLIIFDGNHRREALILLYKTKEIDIKVCCYIYKNNTLTNDNIHKYIVEKFKIINQNTPIPDIYNDIVDNLVNDLDLDNLIIKKNIIENVFSKYKKDYKKYYSIKSKCQRPNFNETIFKDLCNIFTFNNNDELIFKLDELNDKKKEKYTKKKYENISENILNKCNCYGLYLFIDKV